MLMLHNLKAKQHSSVQTQTREKSPPITYDKMSNSFMRSLLSTWKLQQRWALSSGIFLTN
ncbi:hypothetical protein HYC85_016040 [Camellia sinensis]|uniref:Uncharacterized protein n=1 Tax=Camellia sinensis TaxID=4442 RepID=A0A7J7GYF8_CAMSI|nr:hypothetical protein HYC85_016040 [Camellia sinensis]